MSFFEKLTAHIPTLSYEFLPPRSPKDWATLYGSLAFLPKLQPDFVSVTYGAGGSTRVKTVDLVSRIQDELGVTTVPHLTCVGHSQDELISILDMLRDSGIRSIMALRGDPPKGASEFQAHPEGFQYASDLIRFIADRYEFTIGCSYYPERHPQAVSLSADIDALKVKQDNGAAFATSQLFFDNDAFYRYRELAEARGVNIPLIVGLLPVTATSQLAADGFIRRCGAAIPDKLVASVTKETRDETVRAGIEYAVEQGADLLANGAAGIHLYTMNKSMASGEVTRQLRSMGYFNALVNS